MTLETIIKVKLNNDEKEALLKVQKLVNELYDKTGHYELEFEDDIENILSDVQNTIRCIF